MEDRFVPVSGRLTEQTVLSPKITNQIKKFMNSHNRGDEEYLFEQSKPLGNHNRNKNTPIKDTTGNTHQRSSSAGSNHEFIKKNSNKSNKMESPKEILDEQLKRIIDANSKSTRGDSDLSSRKSLSNKILLNQTLEKVDLTYGKLEDMRMYFKENFNSLRDTLQDLNLSYMSLGFFPMEALDLRQLTYLKLDYNNIKLLPERLVEFEQLEYFSVSNNCLEALPQNFNKLNCLKCLNLGKNLLSRIGPELTFLPSLEVLYIYGNPFTWLPVNFPCLPLLKEFALEWFKYTEPPINPILRKPASSIYFDKLIEIWDRLKSLQIETIGFKQFLSYFSIEALDFNRLDGKARTMLHVAGLEDELGVVAALTEDQPHLLNKLDKDGHTALTLCLLDGRLRSSNILLSKKADATLGGAHYGSALHLAVTKQLVDFVYKFLQLGCNPNSFDCEGNTPLHLVFSIFAKDEGKSKLIAEALLSSGAKPNIKNKEFFSPIHLAVKRNQKHAVAFAISYNSKMYKENHENLKGEKQSFKINQRGGKQKWTALHFACNQGNMEIIQMLSEYKRIDLFSESVHRQQPRDVAFPSLLLLKTIRRQEENWIKKNIIRNGIQKNQKRGELLNLNAMIDKTMKKKESMFEVGTKDIAEHNRLNNRYEIGVDIHINAEGILAKYFSNNPNNESILDPDITAFELQEDDFGNVDEFCASSRHASSNKNRLDQSYNKDASGSKQKNTVLISCLESLQNDITVIDKRISEKKGSAKGDSLQAEDFVENNSFIQEQLFNRTIGSLDLSSFLKETERLELITTRLSCTFSERAKALVFLMLLHYKFSDKIKKFRGAALPLGFFIVNEFLKIEKYYTKFNRCDVLLKSLERILSVFICRIEAVNHENKGEPNSNSSSLSGEEIINRRKEWLLVLRIINFFVDINHWRIVSKIPEIFSEKKLWSQEMNQIRKVILYNLYMAIRETHSKNSMSQIYSGRARSRSISNKKEGGSSMRDLSLDSKTTQQNKLKINRSFNDLIGTSDSKNTSTDYEDSKDNKLVSARQLSEVNGKSFDKAKQNGVNTFNNLSAREHSNNTSNNSKGVPSFPNNVLSKKDIQTKRISKVNALDRSGKIRADIIKGEKLEQDDEHPILIPKKNELFLKNKRKEFAPMIDPSSIIYSRGQNTGKK